MSTSIGIDVWAGNPNLDEATLLDAGVEFMIVRLNSISGGLSLDTDFTTQWAQSGSFVHWPYYVYSPWYTGQQNYDWLAVHMPPDAHAVSIDVEVLKAGYSPHDYATQLDIFRAHVAQHWNYSVYTGAGYVSLLDHWPSDVDYWWARYPYALYPDQRQNTTWEHLIALIDGYGWHPGSGIPGPCKLWQCTADRYVLPGCGMTCVDINQWNGTLEELQAFAGYVPPPTDWAHALTTWARGMGYTGPGPE